MPDLPPTSNIPERQTALPHWHTPGTESIEITDGKGATVFDNEGNAYLDFLSQLYCVNAGYDNKAIIEAIENQLQRIPYVSSAKANDTRTELASIVGELAPSSVSDIFFSISGSEANEAAIQMAREYQGAPKVLTRWRSYHGGTYGAAGLTGDPETRTAVEKFAATTGVTKFLPPLPHRSPFNAESLTDLADRAANHLEFVIRNEGPDSIAALLTEPIGGTSGAYPAPPGYFERVRDLCDEYDILLISDEVITGFGRCGEWFGIQTEGIEPDMITFAKGVTSAYIPLAGVVSKPAVSEYFHRNGVAVGQTFAGHPVACAAGVAAVSEYRNDLIDNVRSCAPLLETRLRTLEETHPEVGSVHGRGFLWSVEFTNPETGKPFVDPWVEDAANPVSTVRNLAQENGVLFGSGRPDIQIIVAPPFTVTEDEITEAVSTLDTAIEQVFD